MARPDEYNWGNAKTADTDYFRTGGSPMSAALINNGYAAAEIPAQQDHNTLFRNSYLWSQFLDDRADALTDTLLYSSSTATWNGSALVLGGNLDLTFRKSAGVQINRIASGTLTFTNDGDVLVVFKDFTNASPVTLTSVAYGSLAVGKYAIVAGSILAGTQYENEMILFRRNGTNLECPVTGAIYSTGATINFGSLINSAFQQKIGLGLGAFSAVSGPSTYILTGDTTSATTGAIGVVGSRSSNGIASQVDLYNAASGASDKRLVSITASRSGADSTGSLGFYVSEAGTLVSYMALDAGNPTMPVQITQHFGLTAGKYFYLDGGSNTRMYQASDDDVRIELGGTTSYIRMTEAALNPHCSLLAYASGSNQSAQIGVVNDAALWAFRIDGADGDYLKLIYDAAGASEKLEITPTYFNSSLHVQILSGANSENMLYLEGNSLTTGRLAYLYSNSADTNGRNLLHIVNDNPAATGANCLSIQQDADAVAISVVAGGTTTDNILSIQGDSLTTGSLAYFYSNSSSTSVRNLVEIHNDNSAATGAIPLSVTQDGNEYSIVIDQNGEGTGIAISMAGVQGVSEFGLEIAGDRNSAANTADIRLIASNGGAGNHSGIRFSGTYNYYFEIAADGTDPTGGGGAATGRLPILVGGALRYLAYY